MADLGTSSLRVPLSSTWWANLLLTLVKSTLPLVASWCPTMEEDRNERIRAVRRQSGLIKVSMVRKLLLATVRP